MHAEDGLLKNKMTSRQLDDVRKVDYQNPDKLNIEARRNIFLRPFLRPRGIKSYGDLSLSRC